ncbi:unnamed protein product [Ilex paraguariensis]|uniref:Uncharacterized protein n=1 Tax=Ilex paraguariensis TaxID=185542 RepID=A0ABC8UKE2_9AQUA
MNVVEGSNPIRFMILSMFGIHQDPMLDSVAPLSPSIQNPPVKEEVQRKSHAVPTVSLTLTLMNQIVPYVPILAPSLPGVYIRLVY